MALPIAIVAVLVIAVIALTVVFIRNARVIRRDVRQKTDALQARLEEAANAVVDDLFKANRPPTQ
jgi:ABC-type transport system involved in cytochrome bd biosynthesis fused ATPase/permease subunit